MPTFIHPDDDTHLATPGEAAKEFARNDGADHPDRAWVLTPWDTWEPNPAYVGPAVPHPEDDGNDAIEMLMEPPPFYSVAVYLVDRRYGGPEEGGWWYDTGTRIDNPHDYEMDAGRDLFAIPRIWASIDAANAHVTNLQAKLDAGINAGRRDTGSVLSTGRYQAEVHSGYPPAHYPEHRPCYE